MFMELQSDPHQFTRDAWEANAEIWDARMGDEGNDFFNIKRVPYGLCYRGPGRNRLRSGNRQSSEQPQKRAQSHLSRVRALLDNVLGI